MKKIIVITLSLLFAAMLVLGNNMPATQLPQQEVVVDQLDYQAQVVGQELILTIETTQINELTIELYNLTGKRVGFWKVNENNKRITVTNKEVLAAGLYIVKVTNGKQAKAKKFQS